MKTLKAIVVLTLGIPSFAAQALDANSPDISNITVDAGLLQTVQQQLPESTAVDTSFLNTDYDPYLSLNEDANVSVTFLDEGAGYKNSLGWITFADGTFDSLDKGTIDIDNSGDISLDEINAIDGVETGWLFPNVSKSGAGGNLLAGDTVQIGDEALAAGTSVSFFLGQNAWTGADTVSDGVLDGSRQVFYGLDFLNPEADFTSTFESSLANSRHVAMLFADESQEQVIMGFEDLNRVDASSNDWNIRSDEDFNDAVFIINSDPATAFGDSNIATAPIPALGSGVMGMLLFAGLCWMSSGAATVRQPFVS